MQVKDVTVRVQSLDGVWETLGVDRARGIWPEGVQLAADRWGPSSASCDLHRDPGAQWPDIGAFTPIEFDVGGVVVWSGRVKETPARDGSDRVLSVQCEGMQYHLDDDQYERRYVSTKLSEWKDSRGFPGQNLTRVGTAAGQVTADGGAITIGWAAGAQVTNGCFAAVEFDFGASVSYVKRIVIDYQKVAATAGAGNFSVFVRNRDSDDLTSAAGEDCATFDVTALSASGVISGTFTTPRRYVSILIAYTGTSATTGEDNLIKMTGIRCFADTAYESGNQSVLKAPQVINDALDRATILLSPDRSQIDPTSSVTFSIPEFAPTEPLTPRQAFDAVNAYHNYVTAVDAQRRMVFAPQPAAPQWEVGAWSGMDFQDASANSGEDIYNRVIVTAQTPAGEPVRVERSAGQQPGVQTERISSPAASNPSFDVDTASWSPPGGIARTTVAGEFHSAPAGGKWTPSFISAPLAETFTGTFRAGVTYVLELAIRSSSASRTLRARLGTTSDGATADLQVTTSFTTFAIVWTPAVDRTGVTLSLSITTAVDTFFVDSLTLSRAVPTLVDRRGFIRSKQLEVRSALPSDGVAAAQIGDVWLKGHKLTPFKGSVSLTGDAVRDILTGQRVPLERLLLAPQALLRFSDRSNPDDGSHGRDGRIASVTYTPATDEASVSIDNTRANFETLLSRLAVTGA